MLSPLSAFLFLTLSLPFLLSSSPIASSSSDDDLFFVDGIPYPSYSAATQQLPFRSSPSSSSSSFNPLATTEAGSVRSTEETEGAKTVSALLNHPRILQRRHEEEMCPLGLNGPNVDDFYQHPTDSSTMNPGFCSTYGIDTNHHTCCKDSYLDDVNTVPRGGVYAETVNKLIPQPTLGCNAKLNPFYCGVCSGHQESFTQSFSFGSEIRFCQSYCDSLVSACSTSVLASGETVDSVYHSDGAKFCSDLFQSLENTQISIVQDVEEDGSLTKLREICFSDAPECGSDDFVAFYTECDYITDSRAVYFDYKSTSVCRGGHPLPEPIFNLTCHQTCPPGHFLPIGETECYECTPGTHSPGGYYVSEWKEWPPEFGVSTYCEENNGMSYENGILIVNQSSGACKGWVLNDTFIESGENTDDSQQSVLEFTVYLVRDGSVTFDFKTLSEPFFDGLVFLIDGFETMPLVTQALDWTEVTYPLSSGFHNLKWIYFKDVSESTSLDMAMIDRILVVGTEWADSYCDECKPGYYSGFGQILCSKCPADFHSSYSAATECDPCLPDEFSVPGSAECLTRPECTADDYYFYYTPCENGARNKIYVYKQPIICKTSTFSLPPNENGIECAPCNPGMYRPLGASSCSFCPEGEYSSSLGALTCSKCPAGTSALKTLYLTQFDSWNDLGMWTNCVGDCGSSGWRLLSDTIDSGDGHGALVDVNLYLNVTVGSYGVLVWKYNIICHHICRFQIIDVGVNGGTRTYFATSSTNPSTTFTLSLGLAAGNHTLKWVFSKIDSSVLDSYYDRLVIQQILVYGVTSGGATSCSTCPAGYASIEGQSTCTLCERGTFSKANSSSCTPCAEGFFSNITGASSCLPCGPNTQSTPDRTDCDYNGCTYSPIAGVKYDLSPLQIKPGQDLYGPIWDKKNHAFYLNPCTRSHSNRSCYNLQGQPILSHACQLLPMGYSMDLGYIQGYLPLNDSSLALDPIRSGLLLVFSQGTVGCPSFGKPASPRSAAITFICDPGVGIGTPVTVEPVENPPCSYNFIWASSYACPICTEDDYDIVIGQCVAGLQSKTYVPRKNPNRCTGGVSAPPPTQIPCVVSTTICPPGTYIPGGNETQEDPCTPARKGRYSIGGGFVVNQFDSFDLLPSAFSREGGWRLLGELVQSGEGDTAFTANVFLIRAGYVSFEYKVVSHGLIRDGRNGFHFTVDGIEQSVQTYSTQFRYLNVSFPVQAGEHTLKWRFIGGVVPNEFARGSYASVDYIEVYGTDYAARNDIPCPRGRYQDQTGQTSCKICPAGFFSYGDAEVCTPCAPTHYSLPESSDCTVRKRCEGRDFVARYTPCSGNNMRTKYYEYIEPKTCILDNFPFTDNGTTSLCPPCPQGYIRKAGVCTACGLGKYWDSLNELCANIPAGNSPILVNSYILNSNTTLQYLDDIPVLYSQGLYTYNSGEHWRSGWRVLNQTLDSGFHSSREVDSVLVLVTRLIHKGSISFSYQLTGDSDNAVPVSRERSLFADLDGLEFFIQGKLQSEQLIPFHPPSNIWKYVSFELPEAGDYYFAWVYHQPHGFRGHQRILLTNISIVGDISGTALSTAKCPRGSYSLAGSVACTPCPIGTEAPVLGSDTCTACKSGYFTDITGTADCEKCGAGTNSTVDRSACDISTCIFQNGQESWDLNTLSSTTTLLNGDIRYALSLCQKVSRDSMCFSDRKLLYTHVCSLDMETGIADGKGKLANVYFDVIAGEPRRQLRLVYTKGSVCSSQGDLSSTNITFICDDKIKSASEGLRLISSSSCLTEFEWKNIAGCNVCTAEDYTDQIGQCTDGKQTVTTVRSAQCNGPDIKEKKTRQCSSSYAVPVALAIFIGLLFVALLLGLVIISIRNRKLHQKYEMLVTESGSQRGSGPQEGSWNSRDDEKL